MGLPIFLRAGFETVFPPGAPYMRSFIADVWVIRAKREPLLRLSHLSI